MYSSGVPFDLIATSPVAGFAKGGQRRVECREHAIDPPRRVARSRCVVVREHGERVAQVIERDDGVVDAEDRLGKAPRSVRIVRREGQPLESACGLVTNETNGAAAETREAGMRRRGG